MIGVLLSAILIIACVHCTLWPKGIVHYTINSKDYDLHSQDVIRTAFGRIEREICVKFFNTPMNYSASIGNKILYISNPEKMKDCPSRDYDYSKSVVDMAIGYKCLNVKDIARIVVEMLRASVSPPDPANNFDLVKKYQQMVGKKQYTKHASLLTPADRNFLNAYYHTECSNLDLPGSAALTGRRADRDKSGAAHISEATWKFYNKMLWPIGVVMYGVDSSLRDSAEYLMLKYAMSAIEMASCIVFQGMGASEDVLVPKNLLWFGKDGADEPALGFVKGNQTINLMKMTHGWPGHTAHLLNNLMRALGVPMMSNRYDRGNHVNINWSIVEKGKEYLLERMPEVAWFEHIAYDFNSVTHAPANYLCANCDLGAQTVQPQQDHLWQRTLSMGHSESLSPSDVDTLSLIYSKECSNRFRAKSLPVARSLD